MYAPSVYPLVISLVATLGLLTFGPWQRAKPLTECEVYEKTIDKYFLLSYNYRTAFSKRMLLMTHGRTYPP